MARIIVEQTCRRAILKKDWFVIMRRQRRALRVGSCKNWNARKRRIHCHWRSRTPRRHLPITDWIMPEWQGVINWQSNAKIKHLKNFGNQIGLRAS